METSSKGVEFIKRQERLCLQRYLDSGGCCTIGYGHTGKNLPQSISVIQANKYLSEDVKTAETALNRLKIGFLQQEYDALVSFVFNVGVSNFETSTLRKKLIKKAGTTEICREIKKWHYVNKKSNQGLLNRRNREVALYQYGLYCL